MAIQAAFTLTANYPFASLANMIISQEVFADQLGKHQTLVDKARVDGTLYGDRKLYYATDVLKSHAWGKDSEAANLLAIHRPKDPKVQAIVLDTYRQIDLTLDDYLSKQAWSDEGSFSQFASRMLGWLRETKKVHEGTLYNVFIGTDETSVGAQMQTVDITTAVGSTTGDEKNRLEVFAIANKLADLLVEMGDYNRDFNDYGNLHSYDEGNIKVIWNSKYLNKIRKVDTPTIFNRDGLVDKLGGEVLPARYFGTVITSANVANFTATTPSAGKPIKSADSTYVPGTNHANGCLRAVIEKEVTVGSVTKNCFPGDEIPAGATVKAGGDFELGEVYIEEDDVICKIVTKLPPIMSAFEVGTSFFNPKSLTNNHYLTWGYNSLQHLKDYPFITVKAI